MRARVVDWSLLALVLIGIGTGLGSFLVGDPQGHLLFVTHGALGLAILGVLVAKVRRVTPVVLSPKGQRLSAIVGIVTALMVLFTVGIGLWWVVFQKPINYPNGMILHTTAAFVLLGFCLWHLLLHYRPLRGRDIQDRRSLLRLMVLLAGGGALWGGVEVTQRIAGTAGVHRRFTGSRKSEGTLPVTMWLFDNPAVIATDTFLLEVDGEMEQPLRYTLAELSRLPQSALTATIDCTGGWYSEQEWQGVNVGTLLAEAMPRNNGNYVRFRSITGYRWSLPIEEARKALLATHVGGIPLMHGNGAPLRLVAPGRRGFQWVKWVVAVEVLEAPDYGQWAAIFTSGVDEL